MPLPLQKKTLKPASFICSAPGYTSELHTECPLPNEKRTIGVGSSAVEAELFWKPKIG